MHLGDNAYVLPALETHAAKALGKMERLLANIAVGKGVLAIAPEIVERRTATGEGRIVHGLGQRIKVRLAERLCGDRRII